MSIIPMITRREQAAGNPGDVFIGWGQQHLIKSVRPDASFLLIDKFSDVDFKKYRDLLVEKQIVYAGMPQYNNLDDWCFWYDWDMYKNYLIPLRARLLSIAGGSGFPEPSISPKEFSEHCLKSRKTKNVLTARYYMTDLSVVRDLHSYQLLQDCEMPVELLPCTALWAASYVGVVNRSKPTKTIGLVPPSPGHINPKLFDVATSEDAMWCFVRYFNDVRKQLFDRGYKVKLICNAYDERWFFRDWDEVFYTNDPIDLMRAYAEVDGVISARVHGAIPVASFCKPAVLLGIDSRHSVADPIGIPKLLVGTDDLNSAVDLLFSQGQNPYSAVIDAAYHRYLEILDAHLL